MAGSGYRIHLSIEATAFVAGLPRREQRRVLDAAERIAKHPFGPRGFRSIDSAGRVIENVTSGPHQFSFWVDHGAREIRITEILRV